MTINDATARAASRGLNPGFLETSLEHDTIRLIPASSSHAAEMASVINASPLAQRTFNLFGTPPPTLDEQGCRTYLDMLINEPHTFPFTLIHKPTGDLIGGTTYCDVRPRHRALEIGWTWIAPPFRNTRINPEMKLTLLRLAFETDLFPTGPAVRVQLKTHHRNITSQRAIAALGARHEGILRNHVIMPDGEQRHTVIYSITTADWPIVKQRLLDRLSRAQPTRATDTPTT